MTSPPMARSDMFGERPQLSGELMAQVQWLWTLKSFSPHPVYLISDSIYKI
jgi:hypothetical protein